MQTTRCSLLPLFAVLALSLALPAVAAPKREEKAAPQPAVGRPAVDPGAAEGDLAAERLVKSAEELLAGKEYDRAVRMLETVIERYPESQVRYRAWLVLGKHCVETRKEQDALKHLRHVQMLEKPGETLKGDIRDVYLEAIYLMGVSYFQTGQYAMAFPLLRKITSDYPNTIWANQAYYYIGMCHFSQGNWQKAIDSLGLVGTFVDPDSPAIQYVEAGRRFYVKLEDPDLPILHRLGRSITVAVQTTQGDKETIPCTPLSGKGELFIGSIPTDVGTPRPGDKVLQVIGGDAVDVTYLDDNTQAGEKDKPRKANVKVISTAALDFTLGTFESRAVAAFLGQPVFVLLQDADLDKTPGRDKIEIKLVSRYRDLEAEEAEKDRLTSIERMIQTDERAKKYRTRDEITLTLTEVGEGAAVRSGRFAGTATLIEKREGAAAPNSTPALACITGDEIFATYIDEQHIGGEAAREVVARISVSGEIESRPMATQYIVADPVLRAKKNLVEATAFLELARIFRSMGLNKGAADKCDMGLAQTEAIVRSQSKIPRSLLEEAFQRKWELEIVKEDFDSAIATCQLFNKMFPDSPVVDQALLGIGKIHLERKDYAKARTVFEQILKLPNSLAKAEAQYRIAETVEAQALAAPTGGNPAAAMPLYKLCAERYPDSEFAGSALGKLIDYYVEANDYPQAEDLLKQVFEDHPDAKFLDAMLLKWTILSYRVGNYQKAQEKCSQLLFEYPGSGHAEKAKSLLPRIEGKLKAASTVKPAGA